MFYGNTLQRLEELEEENHQGDQEVPVEIAEMGPNVLPEEETMICTKYKTVEKKVKPSAGPLPTNSEQKIKEVSEDPGLRKSMDIGHTFTNETQKILCIGGGRFLLKNEEELFREMLEQHGKAFAFT